MKNVLIAFSTYNLGIPKYFPSVTIVFNMLNLSIAVSVEHKINLFVINKINKPLFF